MSGDWREKLRKGQGRRLSDLPKKSKALVSTMEDLTNSATGSRGEIESKDFIELAFQEKARFLPKMDFSDPSKFVKFASAAQYYKDSIARIHNTYPYDGSHTEKLKWSLDSSYLDMYILEVEYPKTTGYINFKPTSWGTKNLGSLYGLPSAPEYIYFSGGPNADPEEDFKTGIPNIYNSPDGRESNLAITQEGNTVEFWLKKEELVASSKTKREVIFDCYTSQFITGSSSHARLRIELDTESNADHWVVTLLSGSHPSETGFREQEVGINASITGSLWHHHAFTFSHSDSDITLKYYNDGVVNQEVKKNLSTAVQDVRSNLVATIGCLATQVTADNSIASGLGYGQLSGSMDEFRYWKTERDAKQIGLSYNSNVHGGTNNSLDNISLGVYYKFNEGITLTSSVDQSVLDYSGRISNGKFIGYTSNTRNTGSALSSHNKFQENRDPILYSFHPDVKALHDTKVEQGAQYDYTNSAALMNTLPSWILDEALNPAPMGRTTLKELTQIVSSYFDTLFFQIKNLPQLKQLHYSEFNNLDDKESVKPYPFMDKILSSFSFDTADIFSELTSEEKIINKNDTIDFGRDITEIKDFIYRNIYNNLSYIYKTKGTEASFRNLIRCFGIGREVIDIAAYSDNYTYKLEDKLSARSSNTRAISFSSRNSSEASIYQGTDSFDGCNDYIPGIASPAGHTISYSVNVNAPARIDRNIYGEIPSSTLKSSIFGVVTPHAESLNSPDGDTTTNQSNQDLKLYLVKEYDTSLDAYFVLESTSMDFKLSAPVISNIYDDNNYNIAVIVKPSGGTFGSHVSGSSDSYSVVLRGMSYSGDLLEESFEVESQVPKVPAEAFLSSNKRHYVGAEKLNLTGSIIDHGRSDLKVISFRKYLAEIKEEDQKYHALDTEVFGLDRPMEDANLFISPGTENEINNYNSMVLNWEFNTVTGSDSLGSFNVYDLTSKTEGFGPLNDIVSKEYPGRGHGFVANDSKFAINHIIAVARQHLPETMFSSDMVTIKNSEEGSEIFQKDSRPIVRQYAFEKNMYKTISEEMMKFVGSVSSLGDLIGDPVNKYRKDYKDMEKIRQHFFKFVNNDLDLEKFINYYRWLDTSISHMIDQLKPATVEFSEDIRTMIESHVFERNKYEHKFPTIEFAKQTPEAPMFGINELLYDWEHGHAPLMQREAAEAAVGVVRIDGQFINGFDEATLTLESTDGTERVYVFDKDTAPPSSGLAVNISGLNMNKAAIGAQLVLAINSTGGHENKISAVSDGNADGPHITLTQLVAGEAGNTTISKTDPNSGGLGIQTQFAGGSDENTTTPSQGANCLWWSDRAERNETSDDNIAKFAASGDSSADTNREMIRQFVNSDISGSTYALRKFAKPYRLTVERDVIYMAGHNFNKANKLLGLYEQNDTFETSIGKDDLEEVDGCQDVNRPESKERLTGVFQTTIEDDYLKADSDLVMPFSIHSSSVDVGYVSSTGLRNMHDSAIITNLHSDSVYPSGELPLQGPFTHAHVGGLMNRHVSVLDWNKGDLPAIATITFGDVPSIGKTITLISSTGLSVIYNSANTEAFASQKFDRSSGVAAMGKSLRDCINSSHGHNGEIAASYDSAASKLTLNQSIPGEAGNTTIQHDFDNASITEKQDFSHGATMRPESFLVKIEDNKIKFVNQTSPRKSIFRDTRTKRPVNIRNIKSQQDTAPIGNYEYDYQIVHVSTDNFNGDIAQYADSFHITGSSGDYEGIVDVTNPPKFKDSYNIISRFSRVGGTTWRKNYLSDPLYGDMSPYNTLAYANLRLRAALSSLETERSEKFGLRSGSVIIESTDYDITSSHSSTTPRAQVPAVAASAHKANRNTRYFLNDSEELVSVHDNQHINHHIPRSDLQYAWIAKATQGVHSSASFFGHESNYTNPLGATSSVENALTFLSASEFGIAGNTALADRFYLDKHNPRSSRLPLTVHGVHKKTLHDRTGAYNNVTASGPGFTHQYDGLLFTGDPKILQYDVGLMGLLKSEDFEAYSQVFLPGNGNTLFTSVGGTPDGFSSGPYTTDGDLKEHGIIQYHLPGALTLRLSGSEDRSAGWGNYVYYWNSGQTVGNKSFTISDGASGNSVVFTYKNCGDNQECESSTDLNYGDTWTTDSAAAELSRKINESSLHIITRAINNTTNDGVEGNSKSAGIAMSHLTGSTRAERTAQMAANTTTGGIYISTAYQGNAHSNNPDYEQVGIGTAGASSNKAFAVYGEGASGIDQDTYHYFNYGSFYRDVPAPLGHPKYSVAMNLATSTDATTPYTAGTNNAASNYDLNSVPYPPWRELADLSPVHAQKITESFSESTRVDPRYPDHPFCIADLSPKWSWITDDKAYTTPVAVAFDLRVGNYGATDRGATFDTGDPYLMMNTPWSDVGNYPKLFWPQSFWFQYKTGSTGVWVTPPGGRFDNHYFLDDIDVNCNLTTYDIPLEYNSVGTITHGGNTLGGTGANTSTAPATPIVGYMGQQLRVAKQGWPEDGQFSTRTSGDPAIAHMAIDDQISFSDGDTTIVYTYKNCTSGDTASNYGGCPGATDLHVRTGTHSSTNTWTHDQAAAEIATKLKASVLKLTAKIDETSGLDHYVDIWHDDHRIGANVTINEDPNSTNQVSGHCGAAGTINAVAQQGSSILDAVEAKTYTARFLEADDELRAIKATGEIIWRGLVTGYDSARKEIIVRTVYSSGEKLDSSSTNFFRALRIRKTNDGTKEGATWAGSLANAHGRRQQFGNGWVPSRFFLDAGQTPEKPLYLRWICVTHNSYHGWSFDNVKVNEYDPAISAYPWHFSPFESSGLNQGLVWNLDLDTQTSSPSYNSADKNSSLLMSSIMTSSYSKTIGDEIFEYHHTSSYDYYPAQPLAYIDADLTGPEVTQNQTTNVGSEDLGIHLNSYIYNKIGRFGYNTWDQLRKDYNKFVSNDRRNNTLSFVFKGDEQPTRFVEPAVQQGASIITIADRERPQEYIDKIDDAGILNGNLPGEAPQHINQHRDSVINASRERASSVEPQAGRSYVDGLGFMRESWLMQEGEGHGSIQEDIWDSGYDPMLSFRGLASKHDNYFLHLAPASPTAFKALRGQNHSVPSASYSYNDPYYANENIPAKIKEKLDSFSSEDVYVSHEVIPWDKKKSSLTEFLNMYDAAQARLIQVTARTWPAPGIEGLKKTRVRGNYRTDNRIEYEQSTSITPHSSPNSWEEYDATGGDLIYSIDFNDSTVGDLPPGWTRSSLSSSNVVNYQCRVVESRTSGDNNRVLVLSGDREMYADVQNPPENIAVNRHLNAQTYRQITYPNETFTTDPENHGYGYRWVKLERTFAQPFYISFRIYAGTDGTTDDDGDHANGTDPYSLSSPGADWGDVFNNNPRLNNGELVDPLWFQYRIKTAVPTGTPGDTQITYSPWTTVETYINEYPDPDFTVKSTGVGVHNNQMWGSYSGKFTTKKYLIDYGQNEDENGIGKSVELRWIAARVARNTGGNDAGDEWAIDNIAIHRATERQWLKYSGFYAKQKDLSISYNTSCGIDAVDMEIRMNTNVPDGEELYLPNQNHLSRSADKIRTRTSPWPLEGRNNYGQVSSSNPISEFYPVPIHNPDYYIWSLKEIGDPIYDGYMLETGSYVTGSGARYQDYFYRPSDPNGTSTSQNQNILSKLGLPLVSYGATFPEPFLFKNEKREKMFHFKYADPFYYGSPSRLAGSTSRFESEADSINRGRFLNSYANFSIPSSSLDTRGLRGQGELQNDYTIYHMGISSLYVTPPPGMLYSRPILQSIWSEPSRGSIIGMEYLTSGDVNHDFQWQLNQGASNNLQEVTGNAIHGGGHHVVLRYYTDNEGTPMFVTSPVDPGIGIAEGDIIRFYDPGNTSNWFEITASTITTPYGLQAGSPSKIFSGSIADNTGKHGFQVLVGDSPWEASSQANLTPRYETYEDFRENFRPLDQNKSLIPEFILGENMGDYLSNIRKPYTTFRDSFINFESEPANGPLNKSLDIRNEDGLSLTGSLVSLEDIEGYYTTSELSSSFGLAFSTSRADKNMTRVNLKASAVMKLLPYNGFYPAERVIQIGNLFQQDYLAPSYTIENLENQAVATQEAQRAIMDLKISASLSPAMKSLFGPGLLFNSIKSGLAVDYPIFKNEGTGSMELGLGMYVSGTTNHNADRAHLSGTTAYRNFSSDPAHFMNPYGLHPYDNSTILSLLHSSGAAGTAESGYDSGTHPWKFDGVRSNTGGNYGSIVTGSTMNDTFLQGAEPGVMIPKLKPSDATDAVNRIPFEALYDPTRINDLSLYDNEPHPSASFGMGGYNYWKIMDFPFKFNSINHEQLQEKFKFSARKNRSSFSSYSLAMNNFLAEAVDLYNKKGKITTVRSAPSQNWDLSARRGNDFTNKWAMRIYMENQGTEMYDRDSAFGPPIHSDAKNLSSGESLFQIPATRDSLIITSSVDNIATTNRLAFAARARGSNPAANQCLHRLFASDFGLSGYNFVISYGQEDFVIKFFDSNSTHPTRGGAAGAYGGTNYYATASNVLADHGDPSAGATVVTGSDQLYFGSRRSEGSGDKDVRVYKDSNQTYPTFYSSGSPVADSNELYQAMRRDSKFIVTPTDTSTDTSASWKLSAPHETLDTSNDPSQSERRIIDRWIGFESGITTMHDIVVNVDLYLSQILEYLKEYRLPAGSYLHTPGSLMKTSINANHQHAGINNNLSNSWTSLTYDAYASIGFPATFETHPYLVKDTSLRAVQIRMSNTDSSPGPGNTLYSLKRFDTNSSHLEESLGRFNLTGSGAAPANTFLEVGFLPSSLWSEDTAMASFSHAGLGHTHSSFIINTSFLSSSNPGQGYSTSVNIGFAETSGQYPQLSTGGEITDVGQWGKRRSLEIPISRLRTQAGSGSVGHDYITSEEFFDILADGINYNSGSLGFRARSYTNYKGIKRYSYVYDEDGRNIRTIEHETVSPFSYDAYLKLESVNTGESKMSVFLTNSGSVDSMFGPLREEQRKTAPAEDRIGFKMTPSSGLNYYYKDNALRADIAKRTKTYFHGGSGNPVAALAGATELEFTGGRTAGVDVLKQTDKQANWSYDPYVPPFLKPAPELEQQAYIDLIVDYSNVDDPQAPVNDPAFILQHLKYESSYAKRDYSSTSGPAFNHAMSLQASLNLNTMVPDLTNPEVDNIADSPKVWVISPKWESPIMNFADSPQTIQEITRKDTQGDPATIGGEYQLLESTHYTPPYDGSNPDKLYMTSSKGMWHQYSTDNSGYDMKITAHPDTSNYQDLAKALGFIREEGETNTTTVGLVRGSQDTEKKTISEAVVAIPYQKYVDSDNNIQYKTIPFRKMKEGQPGSIIGTHEFINIMDSLITQENNREQPNVEFVNNLRLDIGIQSQIELMDQFILPPQYDFLRAERSDNETAVMFIMPFYHELDSTDVINWWQNLPPSIAKNPKIAEAHATHSLYESTGLVVGDSIGLSQGETIIGLTPDIIFENLRWKVFKVKQRAQSSYKNKLLSSYLEEDYSSSRTDEILQNSLGSTLSDGNNIERYLLSKQGITWNWPYDYFSLVELINVEAKFNFEVPSNEVIGREFGTKHQFGVSKKIYEIARKMKKRRDFMRIV